MAERDQEDFGAARLRRDALRAQLLRRRRRPARLPGRRRARHDERSDPSVLVASVGLWHGLADIRATREQAIEMPFGAKALSRDLDNRRSAREGNRARKSPARASPADKIKRASCAAHIRYAGTDTRWSVRGQAAPVAMKRAFEKAHKARFGFIDRTKRSWSKRSRWRRSAAAPSSAKRRCKRQRAPVCRTPARRTHSFRPAPGTRPSL